MGLGPSVQWRMKLAVLVESAPNLFIARDTSSTLSRSARARYLESLAASAWARRRWGVECWQVAWSARVADRDFDEDGFGCGN